MKNEEVLEKVPEEKMIKGDFTAKIEPPKAKYDPNKDYTWTPADTFVLTGNDFGLVLNTLRALTTAPIGLKTLIMAQKASEAMETSLKAAVEIGIVVEAPKEKK